MSSTKPKTSAASPQMPVRIETQIHRRKKAKAVPPLTAEWTVGSGRAPAELRTPSDRMRKSG